MVTVLAGVIAVLGTSVAFLSTESLNSFFGDIGKTFGGTSQDASSPQSPAEQTSRPAEQETAQEPAGMVSEPAKIECEALNVGGENPVQHEGDECFRVFNAHTWVNKVGGRINERSTTAFVVENTGTKTITIDSISARGVQVPIKDWFFVNDPTIVKPAKVQQDLPVDYVENAIIVAGGLVLMQSGTTITVGAGQYAIVYLNEAGGITENDAGLVLTLQVRSGEIQVEKALPVVKA